jgi:hypothetical protein
MRLAVLHREALAGTRTGHICELPRRQGAEKNVIFGLYTMSCILHLSGVNFGVDTFIAKSKVRPYKVFYRGEPRNKNKPKGAKWTSTGLAIEVSKAEFDDIKGQIKDAIPFLTRNREKLGWIVETKGIRHVVLDFGVDQVIDGDVLLMRTVWLPNKLLRLASEAGLGIELSFYTENMQTVLENRVREDDRLK